MLRHEIEEALNQINIEGSDLNVSYKRWTNSKMTNIVMAIVQHRATPADMMDSAMQLPGDLKDTSTFCLGFITGKSKASEEALTLDELIVQSTEEPEMNFGVNEEQGAE